MDDDKRRYAPPPVQPAPTEAAAASSSGSGPARADAAAEVSPPTVPDPGVFLLEATCEECGAPVYFGEEDRSSTCRYCDSLLVLWTEAGEEAPFYLATRIDGEDALKSLLASYHAMQRRPEIASRYRDAEGNSWMPEQLLDDEIKRIEERYLATLAIREIEKVYAPYRMCLGELGQAFVGREPRSGLKDVSFRVYALELTRRGYDAAVVNLRDRGLRLSLGRLHLLTSKERATLGGRFLRLADTGASVDEAQGLLRHAQDDRLEATSPPRGQILFARDCIVYKPFLWIRYIHDGSSTEVLIDGATEQVAGQPGDGELARLLQTDAFAQPPLDAGDHCVRVFASECPVCGHEQRVDGRSRLQLCTVCHRALEVRGDGMVAHDYRFEPVEDPAAAMWVPFWRYEFQLEAADGRRFRSLSSLHEEIFRALPPPGEGATLAMPAIRCLGHRSLDDLFLQLSWSATHTPPARTANGPLASEVAVRSLPVTLDEHEAREVAPLALYALLDKPRRARINVPKVRNLLAESRLHLGAAQLELIPMPASEDVVQVGATPVRRGLLTSTAAELGLCQRIRMAV